MAGETASDTLLVGMDLGTSSTAALYDGGSVYLPSVVGYPKKGLLPGLLPGAPETLFGDEALVHHNLLDIVCPIRLGTVAAPEAAAHFADHVARLVDPARGRKLHVVVGTPAHAASKHMAAVRQALAGKFHKVQFYPEPFLVVMGLRGAGENGQPDPALNSLVVDIGAGTTDVTVVQGMLPEQERQRSTHVAGDAVDKSLWERLSHQYPDLDMPMVRVTRLKEQHSYVGDATTSVTFHYPILGRPQALEAGEAMRLACGILVPVCVQIVSELLEASPAELAEGLQQNIILAGGGSRIKGLNAMLQARLRVLGFEQAVVRPVKDYPYLVAKGAFFMAQQSRPSDWQNLPTGSKPALQA